MTFNIGDKVQIAAFPGNSELYIGKIGMVQAISNSGTICVEFDDFTNGHNGLPCERNTPIVNRWLFIPNNLVLYREKKAQLTLF